MTWSAWAATDLVRALGTAGGTVVVVLVATLVPLSDPLVWLLGAAAIAGVITTGVVLAGARSHIQFDQHGLVVRRTLGSWRSSWSDIETLRVVGTRLEVVGRDVVGGRARRRSLPLTESGLAGLEPLAHELGQDLR